VADFGQFMELRRLKRELGMVLASIELSDVAPVLMKRKLAEKTRLQSQIADLEKKMRRRTR
jgi:hypothetical protein